MRELTASPEQQAIASFGLGPLRVDAGAGTGKTTTLAMRVLALLDEHGVEPEEMLGVTFTNKAAHELEERIRSARSALADPTRQVDVFTYHGFAAQLLASHGALVGVERDMQVVTPTFARQLLLDEIGGARFTLHDITHRPTISGQLIRLSNDLADNLQRPTHLLDDDDGDETVEKRRELAGALAAYDAAKRRLGVLDYGDLIARAVELVEGHTFVVERVREQYRAVFLDEYQDTNPAQRRLFQALFADGTAVTAVGDPDQTIYEWRGATPDNFASFPEHFPSADGSPCPTLPLSVNRRSGQPILDLANRVRLEIGAGEPGLDLTAADPAAPGFITVNWQADARREADAIAEEARRLHDEEGIAWGEMAVLFRKNKDISMVRDALDDAEIPLQVANLGGLLGIPEIVEIHAWLRVLSDPEDGPALARILLGSQYRLGFGDLAPLARWAAGRSQDEDSEVLDHTMVEALDQLDEIALPDEIRSRLEEFRDLHRVLLTLAQGASLAELTREILTRTGAWHEIDAMPHPAGLSARLNVHRFLDLVEDWSPLEGRPSLEAFLTYLDLMAEDPVEELDTARVADEEAVTLLTVHRAKGLEWDVVFLPALYRNTFPASVRILLDPVTRPYTVPASLRLDPEARRRLDPSVDEKARQNWLRARHHDQEWRLAYVAATRARTHLYLSGAQWHGLPEPNKKVAKPSPLLEIARDMTHTTVGRWLAEETVRPATLRSTDTLGPGPDPAFEFGWDEVLRRTIDDPAWTRRTAGELDRLDPYDAAVDEFQQALFTLPEPSPIDVVDAETRVSVTGLVTYRTCPKRYFWSEVDRLPRRPSAAARRGVDLHRRIELHNRGLVPFEELDEELYDTAPGEEAGEGERGWTAFESSRYASEQPVLTEVPFELPLGDATWLRGRIDAVYADGDDGWEIVDFKSGRRSPGRDHTQLQAYAVAATESALGIEPPDRLSVSFVYLGDGLDVDRLTADRAWLTEARSDLDDLFGAIKDEAFEPTPSEACRRCDFLRFCDAGTAHVEAEAQPSAAQ